MLLPFSLVTSICAQVENLPQNPVPGKCYIRFVTPPQFEKVEKRVLIRPAYTQYTKVPAEYRLVEERVLVKAPSYKYITYPAEYRTVIDSVLVEDPYTDISITPAVFGPSSQNIEVREKSTGWEYQYSAENCKSADPSECMVLQFVEHPAEFKNVSTQRLEQAANYTMSKRGGKWVTTTRQVVAQEARFERVEVPAEYTTIIKRVLVKDEELLSTEVPAEYAVEIVEVLKDKGGQVVWEEIECGLTEGNILPISFETGSARLTMEARYIIDSKLLKLMKDKPNIRVEVASHTDSRGTAEANQPLSQARAESVVNYLVSRGIQRSRLVAKGYGESQLKNRCADGVNCTEAEHAINRRIEYRVLAN